MNKRGKLFGAALGYTFGGPIGAIIGAAIGYAVEDDGKYQGYSKDSRKEIAYVENLVLFLTGAAKADGRVGPEKLRTISDFFRDQLGYRGRSEELVVRLIQRSLRQTIDLPAVCSAVKGRTVYEERLFLVQLAYKVAVSDGLLAGEEEAYIGDGSRLLGVEENDLAMIAYPFTRFRNGGAPPSPGMEASADPYAVLGLGPDCGDEEVRKAYRSLANKYHPDKVLHLGHEFVDLANRKFAQIVRAFESVKKARGIS
jgi:DnaJ like chaperone protein